MKCRAFCKVLHDGRRAMPEKNQFVVLEWIPYVAEFPRFSFATVKHAEELGTQVLWVETCPSIEIAAERVRSLNLPDASAETTDSTHGVRETRDCSTARWRRSETDY
jgi:hypothetical protein